MDAKELRIGNWVYDDQARKIVGITKAWARLDDGFIYYYNNSNVKPIPLTEEILLKCGFEKEYGGFYYEGFSFDCAGDYVTEFMMNGDYIPCGDIKHLHQLQNLYYALTGEELNVEL